MEWYYVCWPWLTAKRVEPVVSISWASCSLHCALSLAAQCIVIGPVCVCVCGSVTTITQNCVHWSSPTGSVGEGSDHLQLIKFWPSCTPGKGVCGGAKIFGSALLQPARSVCISLSAFFHRVVTRTDHSNTGAPNPTCDRIALGLLWCH